MQKLAIKRINIEGVDNTPPRIHIDTYKNAYCDLFIDFCIDSNMCVLNGRSATDDFTCISDKGKSVVDYTVVPHDQLHLFGEFRALRMS